jgi:hypothetical protein
MWFTEKAGKRRNGFGRFWTWRSSDFDKPI